MDIDLDHYRAFYYVAKYGNITRAAAALMNNQPNVTRTIKLLEKELGCTLFVRSSRGVQLTPDGEKLFAHVRIAMEQLEMGAKELMMDQTLQSGTVTIGASEVALRCFLLPVLKEFHQQHPNIRLRIYNYSAAEAISSLKNGIVDISVARVPMDAAKGLSARILCDIPEVAVCGSAFRHLAQQECDLERLTHYPIISLDANTLMYQVYSTWFASHGLRFCPEVEVTTSDQILPIAACNLGIGFVPEAFLSEAVEGSVYRLRLKEPIPVRSLCFLKRKDLPASAAGKRLEEMILSAARK